jgi:hypothetical protein
MYIVLLFFARRQEQVHPDTKRPSRVFTRFNDNFFDCAFDRHPLCLNGLPDHAFIAAHATLAPRRSIRCHKNRQDHNYNQLFRTHVFAPFVLFRLGEEFPPRLTKISRYT